MEEHEWSTDNSTDKTLHNSNLHAYLSALVDDVHVSQDQVQPSSFLPSANTSAPPQEAKSQFFVSLKEREDIAKAAYKTWFRIKPGHKEIKDRWWALYYKKIPLKYQLRDNHLGRQVNLWIEEDLRALRNHTQDLLSDQQLNHHHFDPNAAIAEVVETDEHGLPPRKKKKANSSKEGSVPAYLNVELVHPQQDILKTITSLHSVEGTPQYYALKLHHHVNDGNIDWEENALEKDIMWFKMNRIDIMDKIPTLSSRNKPPTKPSQLKNKTMNKDQKRKDTHIEPLEEAVHTDWVATDIYQTDSFIFLKIDLPGLVPNQDFIVQCDGNQLVVKGERKPEPSNFIPLHQTRPCGKFEAHIEVPHEANTSTSEQVFQNGVLTIKFPLKEKDHTWRTLNINHIKDDEEITLKGLNSEPILYRNLDKIS